MKKAAKDLMCLYVASQMILGGFLGAASVQKIISPQVGMYIFGLFSTIVLCFFSVVALRRSRMSGVSQVNFIGFGFFGVFLMSSIFTSTLLGKSGRAQKSNAEPMVQTKVLSGVVQP